MNFSTTNTGTGVARILGSYAGSANGIMGGWAVKNGQDWATLSGGEVIAYSAYANDTWSAGTNTNVTQSGAVTSGTTNSLRFNTAAPITLTLSGTNTLQSGGILVGSGTGSNDVTITGGTITNSNNAELILNQYNTGGVLAVLSDIALTGTNRTLVKTGEGTVVLGGNNSIGVSGNTGLVAIESGTLRLGSSTALNSAFTDLQLGSITSQLDLNGYNGAVAALYSNNFEGKGITAAAQAAPKISNLAAGTSSTLTIQNGGTYTGSFGEASGAILNLAVTSGTFNINAPSNLSGYGDVITSLPSNMFELITGSITLSGANTTLSVSKDLNIWGALNLNGASTRVTVGQPMGVSYLSGTGVVNAGNPLSVNHIGSAADTFSGTFLANAYNKIYVGGTGTLVLPAITTSVASTSGSGSSLRLSGAATVITPGLTTSGAGSNWSVRVGGESTLKVTGTSGVVIGTSVATNVTGLSDTNAGLTGGTLWVAPSGSGQNITVSGLTALGDATTGAAMFYQNGSTLILDRGQNQSLTFTLGNVGNTFVRNGLQRLTGGTVVIAATDGLSRTGSNGLGTSERLVILGSGAALPTVTNGMVSASLVGQDNDVNKSGDFLTYEGTGISTDAGYRAYDYSGANGLDNTLVGANYTKVAKLTSNQSITSGTTGLYALRIDNSTLSISSGASLRLGDAASTLGGLILNGGTIDGDGSLLIPTGANGELAIYTSLAGGTINATISGGGTSQSGGLTKFGEGTLLVTKAMTYTFGFTSLNEGVLDLNGFALPSNTALRLQGGVLQSRGSFINGLSSANGGVLINGGGFAARGGAYDISIGGVANPTKFTWGDAGSNNINGVLIFGSTTADNTVTLRNAIDLGTGNRNGYLNNYSSESMRVVRVVDNVNSSTDRAVLSGIISSSSPYQGLAKDGNGELYLTAANTYTGPTAVTAGKLWISADNNLGDDPDAAYAIDGTPTPGAVIINGGATLGLYNTFTLSSTRNLLLASGATGATASRIEVTANQTVTFGGKIGNYIGEVGSLDKTGAGSLILNGVSQYTGTTKVSAGTLVVNGSITSSSGVEVAAGASLGGRGSVGAISGAGLIGPGNSPGILTGTNVNASAGLDFAFEFTLANAAPNYGSASSPGNDVLRLTSATPFVASLNSGNEVAIYLNLGSLNEGDVVYGGFYADSGDFFGSISGAKFTYYLADAGGAFSYGGVNYSLYTANEIQASTVAQTANFGQGDINGYVMQLEVVPEPSTWLLVGMGLFSVLIFRRRLVRRGN
jgi:fibronectin-binding autotransporter adhesin